MKRSNCSFHKIRRDEEKRRGKEEGEEEEEEKKRLMRGDWMVKGWVTRGNTRQRPGNTFGYVRCTSGICRLYVT